MRDDYRAQLKAFLEEDEARWKYEAEEIERQNQILQQLERADEHVRATLEKAGVNVSVLDEAFYDSVQRTRDARAELAKITPPRPQRRARRDRFMLQKVTALANFTTTSLIFPPASAASGNSEECGFNVDLGEANIKKESEGDGWGWGARGIGTDYCTLWFHYFPPAAGELTLEPHIECKGAVFIQSNDHVWSNTWAEARLKIHFDLFQHYWDGEVTYPIVDEYCEDCLKIYDVDEEPPLSKTLSVSAGDVVWIKITISTRVHAQSSSAFVALDFREGSEQRIRVDHIVARLQTERPVLVGGSVVAT